MGIAFVVALLIWVAAIALAVLASIIWENMS